MNLIWNWEKYEPSGTQTHTSHKIGECINPLDDWVHLFPVTALDTQELIVNWHHCPHMADIFVEETPLCDIMGSLRHYYYYY